MSVVPRRKTKGGSLVWPLVLALCLSPTLTFRGTAIAQPVLELYRPGVKALADDGATPEMELADEFRTVTLGKAHAWPDEHAVAFGLTKPANVQDGYAVVDTELGQVVGFVAAEPRGPVPMEVMPAEEASPIAEEFCKRHLPELFAEGGEVSIQVEDEITPLGARMVHLRRSVQGVKVPTLADVGVRVYDGKVVYLRRKHVPLSEEIVLPGAVTLDRARKIATGSLPTKLEPVFWFDAQHEVVVTREGQLNAWSLWAEVKTKDTGDESRLGAFYHWQIDANTEEAARPERFTPSGDLYRRYAAAGGERAPFTGIPAPDSMFEDRTPVFSPDGTRVLLTSTRPRDGYPAWVKRPAGLFVVNADGSDLKCLAAESVRHPHWSPDGQTIVYILRGKLRLVPLAGGEPQELSAPERQQYIDAVWVNDSQLVVYRGMPGEKGELALLDLTQPDAEPKVLTPLHGPYESFGSIVVTADGKSVIYTRWKFVTNRDVWDLFRIDLAADGGEPEMICENPMAGQFAQLLGTERLFLWDTQPSAGGAQMWMLDLKSGQAEAWQPPAPPIPGIELRQSLEPKDVCFSLDGQRIAFAARMWDNDPTHAPATLIWTSDPDGTDLKQVTPWDDAVVPMAGG
jgi:Tol biopolymer transport system component